MPTNVAVVGCGYWGPNIVRALSHTASVNIHTLCDVRRSSLQTLAEQYSKEAYLEEDFRKVAADPDIEAVFVATPAATHRLIAGTLLEAGKHVFVEKPLALTSTDCQELTELAERNKVTLMVGHIFMYNAAVIRAKEYIASGELGEIQYIYSQRLNLGRIQSDLNCLWSFAPHDVSILCYWLDQIPVKAVTQGFSYLNKGVEDVVFSTLHFPQGVGAHLHLSWLDPRKVRSITVVGSKKMLVYDDVSTDARLQIYDKGVSKVVRYSDPATNFGEFQMQIRPGDLLIPYFKFSEPLIEEIQHFLHCIHTGARPRTDGQAGAQVVQILEAMDRSLKADGLPVEV